jgi:hypothetical protein
MLVATVNGRFLYAPDGGGLIRHSENNMVVTHNSVNAVKGR